MANKSTECRKIGSKMNGNRNLKTLDEVMDLKNFPILYSTLTDELVRNSIRLLRVFGVKGCKVIFVTNADKVYAFGLNRDGSLGLGTYEEHIRKPQLNEFLSNKQVVDIAPGFEHCLALTASGQVYAWGQNRYGQLGIKGMDNECTPQLLQELTDLNVEQIHCGAYHSMALTSDGELFSWGHNTFAQLGDRTYNSRDVPTQVLINEKIITISCGANHCMALSETGRVYVWGNNSYGQLGRDPAKDVQKGRLKPMSTRPRIIQGITSVRKAVCGPNHSLLLTTDGSVYAFGINTDGQIGNGCLDNQHDPVKLNPNNNIKIKDIITFYDNHISVAVSESGHCFVWGLVWGLNRVTKPKVVPDSCEHLIDIYGKYSTSKTFYKTIVVNRLEQINSCGLQFEEYEDSIPKKLISNLLFPTNGSNIENQFDEIEEYKTFDEELDVKHFPILNPTLTKSLTKNIRLLYVFGTNASNVIFATNEDKVYGFGNNCGGFLGVGTFEQHIKSPVLNKVLTGKQLIEVRNGFAHCIGLTASGQCYGWGQNKCGQLGIGAQKQVDSPRLIERIADKKVTQIGCGGFFSMALTTDGQLYSWGQNVLGQLGISSYYNTTVPNLIDVKHPIVSISCGRNHSAAVADIGMVYTWGHNEFCQLGREKEFDYRPKRKQWIAFRPFYNSYFKNITFVKAVCGANYTLLLTDDGFVYGFGDNSNGQVGNGELGLQCRPLRINDKIRFKEIISHFDNDLSIGISIDGQCYVWGLADHKKLSSPELIPESLIGQSVFNIYGLYASKKITFKTLVITQDLFECEESPNSKTKIQKNVFLSELAKNNKEDKRSDNKFNNDNFYCTARRPPSPPKRLKFMDNILANNEPKLMFNNRNISDLKIVSENETIYGHNSFLKTRNRKFLDVLEQKTNGADNNEVRINREKFDVFYAFLQYLYGIEPQLNEEIIFDLKSMAQHFDEKDLLEDCTQFIRNLESKPNLNTVCALYEKAINEGMADLEKTCVEFAANNWKIIFKSNEFSSMDDSLSKRLMISIFDLK